MLVGGSMINRMGPFFVLRAAEETGANVAQVARAYAIVREVFGVRRLWREVEALDHKVDAKVQYDAIFQISRMVRRAVYWLLQNYSGELDIESVVKRFQPGVTAAFAALPKIVAGRSGSRYAEDAKKLEGVGLPAAIAEHIAALSLMTQAFDTIELAREFRLPVPEVGQLYFALAKELKLDVIREQIEALPVEGRWRAMARATLRETLAKEQRSLLRSALSAAGASANAGAALAAWLEKRRAEIARVQRGLDDMQMSGAMDFATLSVALEEVGRLVSTALRDAVGRREPAQRRRSSRLDGPVPGTPSTIHGDRAAHIHVRRRPRDRSIENIELLSERDLRRERPARHV